MICPECKQETTVTDKCEKCGVIFNIKTDKNDEIKKNKKMPPKALRIYVVIILILIPIGIMAFTVYYISTLSTSHIRIPRHVIPQFIYNPVIILIVLIRGIRWIIK